MKTSAGRLRSHYTFICLFCIVAVLFLASCVIRQHKEDFVLAVRKEKDLNTSWSECMRNALSPVLNTTEKIFDVIGAAINVCIGTIPANYTVVDYTNSDETKHALMRAAGGDDEKCTLVTIGVGLDVAAEGLFRKDNPNCTLHGADPIVENNMNLYLSVGGAFHPFALGNVTGLKNASVLEAGVYTGKKVVYLDIVTFLTRYVRTTFIDHLWMDAEGAEYELFNDFLKTGRLHGAGITICQWNVEVHEPSPQQRKQLGDFIVTVLDQQQYVLLRSYTVYHGRYFMVNVANEECRRRYFTET